MSLFSSCSQSQLSQHLVPESGPEVFAIADIPPDAGTLVRARLGLADHAPLRFSYVPGPGDLGGTYGFWRRGLQDPRIPVITYSAQFFELMQSLSAVAQIVVQVAPPAIEGPDVQFVHVARENWATRAEFFRSEMAYAEAVIAAVDAFSPHVVLVSSDFPARYWHRLAKGNRLVLLTVHNTFWAKGKLPWRPRDLLRLGTLARNARAIDHAICTSEECARQLAFISRGRIQGRAQFPQISTRLTPKKITQVRRILFVGRIERNKGVFMLLDAFIQLMSKWPDLELTFAGTGSADNELRHKIAAIGSKRVHQVGHLDSQQINQALNAADLLVCPTMSSFNEGLAVVAFEAAAHGVPTLLSSVVPAAAELGKGCSIFAADNQGDLNRVLAELISDNSHIMDMSSQLKHLQPKLYSRRLSWGSQLGQIILNLN